MGVGKIGDVIDFLVKPQEFGALAMVATAFIIFAYICIHTYVGMYTHLLHNKCNCDYNPVL